MKQPWLKSTPSIPRAGEAENVAHGHMFAWQKQRCEPEKSGRSGNSEINHNNRGHNAGGKNHLGNRRHEPPHHVGPQHREVALGFIHFHHASF